MSGDAGSGEEALELLLVHDVALALLDVQMPELDGVAVVSENDAPRIKRLLNR